MKTTTTDMPAGWRPDPFGEHELRLFSPEGRPTAHVSTAGRNSYEEMPGALVVDPPRARAVPPTATVRTPPPVPAWGGARPVPSRPVRARVRMDQLARLVVAVTVLTTLDRTRRVRLVLPTFSTIFLAAMTGVPGRHASLETTSST
jgi:hypothetical protein